MRELWPLSVVRRPVLDSRLATLCPGRVHIFCPKHSAGLYFGPSFASTFTTVLTHDSRLRLRRDRMIAPNMARREQPTGK